MSLVSVSNKGIINSFTSFNFSRCFNIFNRTSNNKKNSRIEKEKRIVKLMIDLYCKKKEGNTELCDSCSDLLKYAETRLSRCKFGDNKPSCQRCPVHCYNPEMREKIRNVMRFSGPRMIIYQPYEAIRHIFI